MNRSVTLQRQGCRLDREGGIWLRSSVPRGERLRRAGRRCSECCKSFSGAAAGALLFAAAQDRSHDARTAATMNYGDYEHGYFIGSIDDEVLSYRVEAQGPRSQIQALVALMGKEYETAYGGQDLFAHSPGSERIVFGDVLPNVGDVLCRFRMKTKALVEAHRGVRCLSSASSRRRRDSKNSSPSMGFTLPLLMSS